jgi:hypothetical protein
VQQAREWGEFGDPYQRPRRVTSASLAIPSGYASAMASSTGQRKLEAKAKLRPWRHKEAALVDAYFAADAAAGAFGAKVEKLKADDAERGSKGVAAGDTTVATLEASGLRKQRRPPRSPSWLPCSVPHGQQTFSVSTCRRSNGRERRPSGRGRRRKAHPSDPPAARLAPSCSPVPSPPPAEPLAPYEPRIAAGSPTGDLLVPLGRSLPRTARPRRANQDAECDREVRRRPR